MCLFFQFKCSLVTGRCLFLMPFFVAFFLLFCFLNKVCWYVETLFVITFLFFSRRWMWKSTRETFVWMCIAQAGPEGSTSTEQSLPFASRVCACAYECACACACVRVCTNRWFSIVRISFWAFSWHILISLFEVGPVTCRGPLVPVFNKSRVAIGCALRYNKPPT